MNNLNPAAILQVSDCICALPLQSVAEILPTAELAKSPGLPPFLDGFLQLGDTVLPVVRLDRLFGLRKSEHDLYSHLVMLKDKPYLFAVDRVLRISPFERESVHDVITENTFNGCVTAEIEIDGVRASLLDPDRILLETERRKIEEWREIETRRASDLITA